MINILLVDHQRLFADCFSLIFQKPRIGVNLSAAVKDFNQGISILEEKKVDIIFINVYTTNTSDYDGVGYLREEFPQIKIIVISEVDDVGFLYRLWMKGVDAILSKSCGIDTIVDTIKKVNSGQKIIGRHIPDFFKKNNALFDTLPPKLSRREHEVLTLLAAGFTRKEVANKLFVSVETINFHCKNLLKKFGLNKMIFLIEKAKEFQLIPQE